MNIDDIPDILKVIIETKKCEVSASLPMCGEFKQRAMDSADPIDFKGVISSRGLSVIAEIKRASPSAGTIVEEFDPCSIASSYVAGGADAVSILTDREYFKGLVSYIPATRSILNDVPILRKDFIIDPVQIYETRALGADSFLLISAILDVSQMEDLLGLGRELGMEPLVECHTELELEMALESGAEIVGVNNRNLHTFEVSLDTAERLVPMLPDRVIAVGESGIGSIGDAGRLYSAGCSAVLIGELLMREGVENCIQLIKDIRSIGKNEK